MPTTTQATQGRLANLKHRSTLYELTMTHPDGRRVCVAYTRKGRAGIHSAVSNEKRAHKVIALTGSGRISYGKRTADGATIGEWAVNFSGRTERDAIVEGELPYIGDL